MYSHLIPSRSIWLLSCHPCLGLPSCPSSLRSPSQNPVCTSSVSHTFHLHSPSHSSWSDTRTIFGEQYRSLSSSICSFLHSPFTSSLLGPNILLCTLFSNTLSLRSSLNVRDQVSHPYKTTGRVLDLCTLIFTFSASILQYTDDRLRSKAMYYRLNNTGLFEMITLRFSFTGEKV